MKYGEFNKIQQSVLLELGIHDSDVKISRSIILNILGCGSLTLNKQKNKITPLLTIEPVLEKIALWNQEAGQLITAAEGLELANSMIAGTQVQVKLKEFQTSIKKKPTCVISEYRYHVRSCLRSNGEIWCCEIFTTQRVLLR